ncbi:GtrA family protein [Stenotrophomonas bentonitica]|uniref:GtrA family protein n=1 Tax=Stenotrophomonas bentonitica TaxID=1450134 RepID=UPI00345E1E78
MRATSLATLYAIFAALSIAVNIGAQAASMAVYGDRFAIAISMIVGTGAGLVCKYVLDKTYIFKHQTKNVAHEARTFGLYTLMGIVTTLIFWSTEFLFHHIFGSDTMRYVGGVLGLVIGYVIKYVLDKKFVFT